jgi:phosphatidyl-myo-inositol dimannoside synthase
MTDALVLAPSFHGADGVSAVSRQIVQALLSRQQSVTCVAFDDPDDRDLVADPLAIPVISASGGRVRFAMQAAGRSLAPSKPRLFVTHSRLAPATWPARCLGRDIVIYLHGVEVWRRLGAPERSVLRGARLVANSAYTLSRFRAANPEFATAGAHVCPPAAPPRLQSPRPFDAAASTSVIVGRLWSEERYKGHDRLLDVWPSLLRHAPAARLIIVGDGDDRPRLEARVRAEGLSPHVEFKGRVTRAALERVLDECRLLVMPSTGEGFGITYLEAMQAGRACIAAPGAAAEVVVDGTTGILVPAADAAALLTALCSLYDNDARAAAMGDAGQRRVIQHFDAAQFSRRLFAALDVKPC